MGWEVPKSKFKWPNVSSAEKMDKSELPKNDQNHRLTEWLELEGSSSSDPSAMGRDTRRIAENWVFISRDCVMGQSFSAAFKSS